MFESHKKTVCSGLAFVLVLTLIILSAGAAFCDNTMGFNSSGVSKK
jgi:hypothetical protein